ncbi:MAG: hypothetical protein ACFFAH_12925 [Promethearchaeota archaeon]
MSSCDKIEKWFCWNGDDKALKKCIERCNYVKEVRSELIKKKFKKNQ